MKIKEIVRDDNMAEFEYYRDGDLWYKVMWTDGELQFQEFTFPVPISDIGNATFSRVERAILLMRYIRKHMKVLEENGG
jgi:hypothetical protein